MVELSLASGDYFRSIPGVLSPRGMLLVAREDQRAAFDADLVRMEFDRISVDEAVAMFPILNRDVVAHGGLCRPCRGYRHRPVVAGLCRTLRAHGGQIVTKARVEAIARTETGWRVTWPGGEAEAALLVNAAGAWVDEVARLAGVQPLGLHAQPPVDGADTGAGWA